MSESMIDRIAAVLGEFRIDGEDGYSNAYVAKMIVGAMMNPTKPMIDAAFKTTAFRDGDIAEGYKAMIEAASQEQRDAAYFHERACVHLERLMNKL